VADTEGQPEGKKQSLIVVFLLALLGGILTMFTPCVFPMIPMTVNFFMNSTDNKRASRRQAWFFGFSIVFLFAVLGAILTLIFGPEALYFIGTHWVPNLLFFIIFLIFSLSFFGLFEIKMPEKWINKSDEQADKGGLLAPFFIALTTVLVSFSCTGPILGAALVSLSTSTTDRWVSLITMLGFGIGFAAPFTLLAMFPSVLKNMKSGGWLNTVKVVFAFLELAFGLKFLSMADLYCNWGLLDRETYLALWIVIFGLMGIYMLGKLKFKGDEDLQHIGVVRLFLAIIDLAFVVYMIPGLWGAPLKAI
jgi:thiol:disulfide interchange protein DsbD